MVLNKIDRISLAGGLLGLLFTDPRKALDDRVNDANKAGWRLVQVVPHLSTNWLITILRAILLLITLGLFTFGDGYLLVFEK